MIQLLQVAAFACYAFAWVVHLRAFRSGARGEGLPVARSTWLGLGLHLAGLVWFAVRYGELPLVGLGPASASLSFVMALFVGGASLRRETRAAGLLVLPVVALMLGEALLVGLHPASQQTGFRGPWFVAHVVTAFVGYAGLTLASAAGAMYVLQFRSLKAKRFGSVFRYFPSLDTLDALNRSGLGIGFPALTLGLVAGWSWTLTYGQGLALGNPQVILGVVTWVSYLAAIGARLRGRSTEHAAAAVSTGAFVVTLVVFLALRTLMTSAPFFL